MPASSALLNSPAAKSGEREITATRVFDAPRRLVYAMFTDPHHVAQWWGPKGFTNTIHEMDVRTGGVWRFVMHGPDGVDYQNRIIYTEVRRPEVLAFSHVSGPVFDAVFTFEELEPERTRVSVRMTFASGELRDRVAEERNAVEGLNETLGRLGDKLAAIGDEVVVSRFFNAPRDVVFDNWTKAEHLKRWWAPKDWTTPACTVDLRVGGTFHYCMRSPDGKDFWGKATYREIAPPEKIVYIDSFSDEHGNVVDPAHYGASAGHPRETPVSVTFEEREGRTLVTLRHTIPANVPERRGIAQGWVEMFDRLAAELG